MGAMADLISRFRVLMGEPTQPVDGTSDQQIFPWFNEVLDDCRRELLLDAGPVDEPAALVTGLVTLPADFEAPRHVLLAGKRLAKLSLDSLLAQGEDPAKTGTPLGYYMDAGKLYAWPIPTVATTVRLYYFRKPTRFSVDGTGTILPADPDIPDIGWDLFVEAALARYRQAQAEGDAGAVQAARQAYDLKRAGFVQALRRAKRSGATTFQSWVQNERLKRTTYGYGS